MSIDADVFDSETVVRLRDMFAAASPDHRPGLLNALGACAGFAAQAAVWRELVLPGGRDPGELFTVRHPEAGGPPFYDSAAALLFLSGSPPDHLGFLSLPATALANPAALPDLRHIACHVADTAGSPAWGRPRLPAFVALDERPRDALARTWDKAAAILSSRRAAEWPALLGAAAYTIIRANRAALTPRLAVTILLEAAVPMSMLDPASVPGAAIAIQPGPGRSFRHAGARTRAEIVAETEEAMPPLLPSLLRALGRIYRPALAFVNLAGHACDDLVAEDHAAFGRIFGAGTRVAAVPVACDVVFLYCRFDPAGRIVGEHARLRGLIAETGARIAVVASPVAARQAADLRAQDRPGAYQAINLVLTLDRRGARFGHFFRSLFERMAGGASMPTAWAQLAPATVNPLHDVPATMCLMEAGHVAFGGMRA